MHAAKSLALAGFVALVSSCATTLPIYSVEPGRVVIGATDHLLLLDGEGRRSAREWVNLELASQSRARGFFSVSDRSEEGFEVDIAGRQATVEGLELGEHDAGLRVDVLEWSGYQSVKEVRTKNAEGLVLVKHVPVHEGSVLLAVTLFDETGHAFLSETEYEGKFVTEDMNMLREETIERAARVAIDCFLDDITPTQVVNRVRLDEEDPGQEHILATAKAGGVAVAVRDLRAYLEHNPLNAIAAYNLGVFLEASGEFEEALASYDRAMELGAKDFYVRARAGCAARIEDARVLSTATDAD